MSAWESIVARLLNAALGRRPRVANDAMSIGKGRLLCGGRQYAAGWPIRTTEHTFICGRTGMGKTTLLHQLMREHLRLGRPFLFVDFHGHAIKHLMDAMSADDQAHCLLLEPWSDPVLGWNPLAVEPDRLYAAIGDLVGVFHHRLWPDAWGPRLEEVVRMTLLALAAARLTLVEAVPFLSAPDFRRHVLRHVPLMDVREFWTLRFERLSPSQKALAIETVLNKLSVFQEPVLRGIVGQEPGSLDLDAVFKKGQTVLVNLAAGHLHGRHYLLAALLFAQVKAAVYRRGPRSPAYTLFLDEFQEMVGLEMLDDALRSFRKFGCSVYLATQHLDMDAGLRAAIFGNCARLCAFAVSAKDAQAFAQECGGPDGKIAATLLPELGRGQMLAKRRGQSVERIRVSSPEKISAGMSDGRALCLTGSLSRIEIDAAIAARRQRFAGQDESPTKTKKVRAVPARKRAVEAYVDF